tara:strand:- start:250 stop:984 length:735 start_codon:yes stop_codon:yes gene_type:complete
MKLLGIGNNAKTVKSDKGGEYLTGIMYLDPRNTKVCPYQDIAKCKVGCLNTAGRAGIIKKGEESNNILRARARKTDLFFEDRAEFMRLIVKDIEALIRKADRLGVKPCVRLNGTSDIQFETIKLDNGSTIFEEFPSVQFYDYTKIPTRKVKHIKNYHLTWSYSEANKKYADYWRTALDKGMNVATVFRKDLPESYKNVKVVSGDMNDLRFTDPVGVIVGLKAKGKARKDTSGFVVDVDNAIAIN